MISITPYLEYQELLRLFNNKSYQWIESTNYSIEDKIVKEFEVKAK